LIDEVLAKNTGEIMKSWMASLVLMIALLPNMLSAADLTSDKRADIRKLIELTGISKVGLQYANAVFENAAKSLKIAMPELSKQALSKMKVDLESFFQEKLAAPGGMVDQLIPIYDKYWTHEEIKALIAFYQTYLGQKSVEVSTKISDEAFVIGSAWGQSLGPEIVRRFQVMLKEQGLDVPIK
jgi:uncharacterized protein